MSAQFNAANSLVNSASPITAYPFTVGVWSMVIDANGGTPWAICNAAGSHFFHCRYVTNSSIQVSCAAGASSVNANALGLSTLNKWVFTLSRMISATNRRISAYQADGIVAVGQSTTSRAPTVDSISLGCLGVSTQTEFLNGSVAELWMTNSDIQPDGLVLSTQTLQQLAYCGPFSIPAIAKDIVVYRSFRNALGSDQDCAPDYFREISRQTWVNNSDVIRGYNPPLNEAIYQRPGDFTRPWLRSPVEVVGQQQNHAAFSMPQLDGRTIGKMVGY